MAKGMDLESLERGRLRKPLFGDREHWFDQPVTAGWWSKALQSATDETVRRNILEALDRVAAKAAEGR